MRCRTWRIAMTLIVALAVVSIAYWNFESRRVTVRQATYAAADLKSYQVVRNRAAQPARFAEIVQSGEAYLIPGRTECLVIGANWLLANKPIHIPCRDGKTGWVHAREVLHHMVAP